MAYNQVCSQVQLLATLVLNQIMPRYSRRGLALRPVHRIKHVIDNSATIAANVQTAFPLIDAKDAPVLANTSEVETGAKVNGIYLKVLVASNEAQVTGAIPNVYLAVWKNPGGNLSVSNITNIGGNDNKRFVIHQEMSMIQNVVSGNPTVLFNGVIKIPKGYIRFGPNDKLELLVRSPAIDISVCLQAHYKEFR